MKNLKLVLFTFLFAAISTAQTKGTLTGIITDKDANNDPLAFATVLVKETKTSISSDENGKYSIELNPGNYTIEFSFVGYESFEKTITIKKGEVTTIDGYMGSGNYTLKDVVAATNRKKITESEIIVEVKKSQTSG
ncbi:carboxypeptidase-like regulatory domain-containing protein [Flavobacterium sp.]|uniref:carboxypeptidase-like regulatory domain-containing protein n=1 Tax=Flavobacterium sp. TaxID=239 RepID=UPI00286DE6D0|nr:carboxypeptidase-like regulatory domain-containing protein [Flavobacterium sp.]